MLLGGLRGVEVRGVGTASYTALRRRDRVKTATHQLIWMMPYSPGSPRKLASLDNASTTMSVNKP